MSVLEITLLVIGLIAFFVSFFIPDKQEASDIDAFTQDEIRNIIDNEIENSRNRINDTVDETVNYAIEKTERNLERISNEKTIALGEYSDSIMNQINKSHQEVVFLSDMLTKNKNDLTVLLGQAVTDAKTASELSKKSIDTANAAVIEADKALSNSRNAKDMAIFAEDKLIMARKNLKEDEIPGQAGSKNKKSKSQKEATADSESINTKVDADLAELANDVIITNSEEMDIANIDAINEEKTVAKKSTRKRTKTTTKSTIIKDGVIEDNDGQISLNFDTYANEENGKNNNDKVLKLHKQGKSNVAIAKQLGLGIGEVKLVIDLFENKSRKKK